jgi:branched-chain amino acid transport system ATP-binding protein
MTGQAATAESINTAATGAAAPLLSVRDLEVRYGGIRALQGVSLDIFPREIVTLIGANGAGKTTLLRTISGMLRPAAGSVGFAPGNGMLPQLLAGLKPHQIVRLGLSHVPEGRQIFPELTVRENLLLGAYQRRDDIRGDIERCHKLFPILKERETQKAGTLSGGEQQMLAIGRALMGRPRLLLLDEPSLGLAPLIVRRIYDHIREINAEGTTIFLVEQNAHLALKIAHRAYVLQTGQIVMADSAAALLANPEVQKAYLGG